EEHQGHVLHVVRAQGPAAAVYMEIDASRLLVRTQDPDLERTAAARDFYVPRLVQEYGRWKDALALPPGPPRHVWRDRDHGYLGGDQSFELGVERPCLVDVFLLHVGRGRPNRGHWSQSIPLASPHRSGMPRHVRVRSGAVPKAWVVRELGTPDKLHFEDVDPSPMSDDLVRIRVRAAAVNFFDLLQLGGTYQVKPELPFIPGADVAINYNDEDFVAAVKRATDGKGADVVYDPVGGDVFDRSTKCVAFEGRIVVLGFTSGRVPTIATNHLLIKNYSIVGLHWGLYRQRAPQLIPECTEALFALYAAGKIRPHVGREAPLADAVMVLEEVASRKTTGKAVLTVEAS